MRGSPAPVHGSPLGWLAQIITLKKKKKRHDRNQTGDVPWTRRYTVFPGFFCQDSLVCVYLCVCVCVCVCVCMCACRSMWRRGANVTWLQRRNDKQLEGSVPIMEQCRRADTVGLTMSYIACARPKLRTNKKRRHTGLKSAHNIHSTQ